MTLSLGWIEQETSIYSCFRDEIETSFSEFRSIQQTLNLRVHRLAFPAVATPKGWDGYAFCVTDSAICDPILILHLPVTDV